MAKGRFDNEIPDLDYRLDHNDDDDEEETEANTTRPFQPGASSTPYHGGEQIEKHAMSQEQSGLPETDFDGNIPLLEGFIHENDKPAMHDRARNLIKRKCPKVDFKKMGPIGFSKKSGNEPKLFHLAKRAVSLQFSNKTWAFLNHPQISSKTLLGQKLKILQLKMLRP